MLFGVMFAVVFALMVGRAMYYTTGQVFGWAPHREQVLSLEEVRVQLEELKTGGYMANVKLVMVEHVGDKVTDGYIAALCRVESVKDKEQTYFVAKDCLPDHNP